MSNKHNRIPHYRSDSAESNALFFVLIFAISILLWHFTEPFEKHHVFATFSLALRPRITKHALRQEKSISQYINYFKENLPKGPSGCGLVLAVKLGLPTRHSEDDAAGMMTAASRACCRPTQPMTDWDRMRTGHGIVLYWQVTCHFI